MIKESRQISAHKAPVLNEFYSSRALLLKHLLHDTLHVSTSFTSSSEVSKNFSLRIENTTCFIKRTTWRCIVQGWQAVLAAKGQRHRPFGSNSNGGKVQLRPRLQEVVAYASGTVSFCGSASRTVCRSDILNSNIFHITTIHKVWLTAVGSCSVLFYHITGLHKILLMVTGNRSRHLTFSGHLNYYYYYYYSH